MHAPSVMVPSHGKSYLWQGGVGGGMSGNALVDECVGGWECVGGLVRRWVGGWVGACEKNMLESLCCVPAGVTIPAAATASALHMRCALHNMAVPLRRQPVNSHPAPGLHTFPCRPSPPPCSAHTAPTCCRRPIFQLTCIKKPAI